MAHYWQRVTVQQRTTTKSTTGAEVVSYTTRLADLEARVAPLVHTEALEQWATPEEQAYEVQLRGRQPAVDLRDRVLIGSDVYDIREVLLPPPFGTPTTVLHVVQVRP